MRFNNNSAVV